MGKGFLGKALLFELLLSEPQGDGPKTTGVPSPQERILSPRIKTHGKRRIEHEIRTVFILLPVGKLE